MVLVRIFLAAVYMAAYATAAVLEIEPRVPVSIITKCTVSNRAALTFVRVSLYCAYSNLSHPQGRWSPYLYVSMLVNLMSSD